jgi:nucleoside-diphosphate-sugar epimerase
LRILVTGADGFTGRHFISHAQAQGYEVLALKSDLTNPSDLIAEVLAISPAYVVHLAAISFVGHEAVDDFNRVNVLGTSNLLDALISLPSKPKSILIASSANVYGNAEELQITEDHPPAPVNLYAKSKLAMELMAKSYLNRLPIFFTRPFNYIGPGQADSFVIPKIIQHFANRSPCIELGNIDVAREFNDVRFVVDSYLALLQYAEVGETYNICSANPVELKFVIDLLSKMTQHIIKVKVNPAFVRANEIKSLSGSPAKLLNLMKKNAVKLPEFSLEDTLKTML